MDANTDNAKPVASKGSVRLGAGTSQREASFITTGQKVPLTSSSNQRYTVTCNCITDPVWSFGMVW